MVPHDLESVNADTIYNMMRVLCTWYRTGRLAAYPGVGLGLALKRSLSTVPRMFRNLPRCQGDLLGNRS